MRAQTKRLIMPWLSKLWPRLRACVKHFSSINRTVTTFNLSTNLWMEFKWTLKMVCEVARLFTRETLTAVSTLCLIKKTKAYLQGRYKSRAQSITSRVEASPQMNRRRARQKKASRRTLWFKLCGNKSKKSVNSTSWSKNWSLKERILSWP